MWCISHICNLNLIGYFIFCEDIMTVLPACMSQWCVCDGILLDENIICQKCLVVVMTI
ncbi:hypothetical protein AMTRI_Chr11g98290 [Amborella trichopoda]